MIDKPLILKISSELVKKIRKEKGITQEDFLYDVGINISRIETGKRDFHLTTLIAICDKMSILPSDFFREFERARLEYPENSIKVLETKPKKYEKVEA